MEGKGILLLSKGMSHRNVTCVFFCLERKRNRMVQSFYVELPG